MDVYEPRSNDRRRKLSAPPGPTIDYRARGGDGVSDESYGEPFAVRTVRAVFYLVDDVALMSAVMNSPKSAEAVPQRGGR